MTLDAETNPDLFWAIRGGGGGTLSYSLILHWSRLSIIGNWAIITSVIVKAFPNTRLVSGVVTFSTLPSSAINSTGVSENTFWEGMKAYWETVIPIVDAGGLGYAH